MEFDWEKAKLSAAMAQQQASQSLNNLTQEKSVNPDGSLQSMANDGKSVMTLEQSFRVDTDNSASKYKLDNSVSSLAQYLTPCP